MARFAAVIAPVIDRIFIRFMLDARPRSRELLARHGFSLPTPLIDYRMILAERPLAPAERDAINRYGDPAELITGYQQTGALTVTEDGTVTATEAGKAYYRELWAMHQELADQRFGSVPLLGKVLEAAPTGPAFSAVYPLYLPAGASDALRTFAQLTALRYQRADAHAAAWAARGLTAAEIVAMEPGPERQSIEDDTNRRAGVPYGALAPQERFDLLAALACL